MAYQKISVDVLKELERMARGQKTKADARDVAVVAIKWVKAGLASDDLERPERLYRLEDPRK